MTALCAYSAELDKEEILSRKEEESLYRDLSTSTSAKQKLVRSNLKLAVKIAHSYAKRHTQYDLDELIAEANLGLMLAIQKFDPSKGCRFSTYAEHWIRQRIIKYCSENNSIVRVPAWVYSTFVDVQSHAPSLSKEHVAEKLQVPLSTVKNCCSIQLNDLSLCQSGNIDDSNNQSHALLIEGEQSTINNLDNMERKKILMEACKALSLMERTCIYTLSGLGPELTPKELAESFGKSPGAIRETKRRAIIKLRQAVEVMND